MAVRLRYTLLTQGLISQRPDIVIMTVVWHGLAYLMINVALMKQLWDADDDM